MASNGSGRGKLLTAGGILSIVAGICQIICSGVLIVDFLVSYQHCWRLIDMLFLPFVPGAWRLYILDGPALASMDIVPIRWAIVGVCIAILGVVAIVGGISAIRRKSFSLSLAGAICARPSTILGILAVIFIALGKREFGASEVDIE